MRSFLSAQLESERMCGIKQMSRHPAHPTQSPDSNSQTFQEGWRQMSPSDFHCELSAFRRESILLPNLRSTHSVGLLTAMLSILHVSIPRLSRWLKNRLTRCRLSTSLSSRLDGWRAGAGQVGPTQQSMTPPLHWFQEFAPLSFGKVYAEPLFIKSGLASLLIGLKY